MTRTSVFMLGTVVGGLLVHAARASVAEPEPGPETGSAGASEQEPAPSDDGNTLPSLDELLGLEEDAGDAPSDAATADEQRARELDRELSAQEAANALVEAVRLMNDSADRLGRPGGTGLTTQRLQEDILRKLDQVIDAAQQNQGQGGGSSAGSQQQQQQSGSPGQQQSGGQSASGQGQGNAESMPASTTDAALGPERLLDASAWGALPERMREALSQGIGDSFSAAYRSLTEAYYKRLAEEAEEER